MADDSRSDETPTQKVQRMLDELEGSRPARAHRGDEAVFPSLIEDPLRASSMIPDLQALMGEVGKAPLQTAWAAEGPENTGEEPTFPGEGWTGGSDFESVPIEESPFPPPQEEEGWFGDSTNLPEPDFAVNFVEVEAAESADELPDVFEAPGFEVVGAEVVGAESAEPGPTLDVLVAAIDASLEASASVASMPVKIAAAGRYVLFTSGSSGYAIKIEGVKELGRPPLTTPLPNVPGWLRGVANLRGDILAIADLEAFLSPGSGLRQPTRMLVVKDRDETLEAGLLVDEVMGIRSFSADSVTLPTAPIETSVSNYLDGCLVFQERLITVLDLDRLLPALQLGESDSST